MTPHDLLAAFETVADSPEGIERLRELVFQLALRGRLVPQDPGEEPANVLLEKIAARKARLVNERKARKDKFPQGEANDSDVPFELPSGWVWTNTAALGFINPRNETDDDQPVSFAPMAVIPKDYRDTMKPEVRAWGEIKKGFTHFADGDVAVAKITPCFQNQKSCVMRDLLKGMGAGTTELLVIRPVGGLVDPRYLLAFYKSPDFITGGVATMTGTAGQQRVSGEYFAFRPIPLPPLAEQHRIVTRVDELMGLLDRLEAAHKASHGTRAAARDAALAALREAGDAEEVDVAWNRVSARFCDLCVEPEDVTSLKEAVLELAVRGRLVPQDSKDEPIGVLLDRVATEKALLAKQGKVGKEKPLPSVDKGETEFALPDSWRWARMRDVVTVTDPNPSHRYPAYVERGIPLLSTREFEGRDGWNPRTAKQISEATWLEQNATCEFEPDHLVIARKGRLGLPRSVPQRGRFGFSHTLFVLRILADTEKAYILWFLRREDVERWLLKAMNQNVGVPTLGKAVFERMPIPLPPLAEQRRIVAKVNQLMSLLDRLEAKLREAQDTQAAFSAAAVHHLDA